MLDRACTAPLLGTPSPRHRSSTHPAAAHPTAATPPSRTTPQALLAVGFTQLEFQGLQRLLSRDLGADMVRLVPGTPLLLAGPLGAALEADPTPAYEAAPLGTRRVVFMSGMYAAEVMEVIGAMRESGEGGGAGSSLGLPLHARSAAPTSLRGRLLEAGPGCLAGQCRGGCLDEAHQVQLGCSERPAQAPSAACPLPAPTTAGLPEAVFAAAVPNNYGRPVQELVQGAWGGVGLAGGGGGAHRQAGSRCW